MALIDITSQLEEPFSIEDIELLPKGSVERDGKTMCMAMPYADVRVYQDRLNKLASGEWSTPPPIALVVGTKLISYVTVVVYGVAHTDVGEAGPGENQGTEAWAQAFKRACSQFGLGRFLYALEKAWVPYDPKKKRIDLDAAGVCRVVRQMYLKAGVFPADQQQNGSKPTPPAKKTVEADQAPSQLLPPAKTDSTITTPLQRAVDAARQRALNAKVISTESEFAGLLDSLGIAEVASGADINAINKKISELVSAGGGR